SIPRSRRSCERTRPAASTRVMDASVPQRRTTVILRQEEVEPLAARTVMALVPICSGTSAVQLADPVAVPEPPAEFDHVTVAPAEAVPRSVILAKEVETMVDEGEVIFRAGGAAGGGGFG